MGARVLVDRVWPRGIRKEALALTEWLRDVAPSTELRHWYSYEPEKFDEFRRRYVAELKSPQRRTAVEHLKEIAHNGDVVLLTATRDVDRSHVNGHLKLPTGGHENCPLAANKNCPVADTNLPMMGCPPPLVRWWSTL